jgi:hypothetical protein
MPDIVRNRMMRRVQFPVTTQHLRSPGSVLLDLNYNMIPPLHESIIADGLDIPTAIAVFEEAMEGSYSDLLDAKQANVYVQMDCDEVKYAIRSWRKNFHADEKQVVFGKPGSPIRTIVTKNGISKHGAGSYLEITPAGGGATYALPSGIRLPEELIEEYNLRFCTPGKNAERTDPDMFYCNNTGWTLSDRHEKGPPIPVFYKNLVIAFNNAAVAAKYGDLSQGTIL